MGQTLFQQMGWEDFGLLRVTMWWGEAIPQGSHYALNFKNLDLCCYAL